MTSIYRYTFAAVLVLASPSLLAADEIDHAAHHAGTAAPSATMPAAAASGTADQNAMKKMDVQMKAMGEMHHKMMNAKSPGERKAMTAEHMKTMHESMKMMGDTGAKGGMGGMGDMAKKNDTMSAEMTMHHQIMEKRMAMMEMMMQMIMDRLPAE